MSTQFSIELLQQVKVQESVDRHLSDLATISPSVLAASLPTDPERMVFWINLYNSMILLILRQNPGLYEDRKAFFTVPRFEVAGHQMSFDDIEHGILRRSKIKLSLGYANKPLVSAFEKMMRVETVDWRLHFALNCGAASCPPIEIYQLETLEDQLNRRANHYLEQFTTYDPQKNVVTAPALMNFFRADFGGMVGIRHILTSRGLIPEGARPSVRFNTYDWTIHLEAFANDR